MKKKKKLYHKDLCAAASYAYQAAFCLRETLVYFKRERIGEYLAQMHEIEQAAGTKRRKLMAALGRKGNTPMERRDMAALGGCIDDITDAVEEILVRIYLCDISEVRKDVFPLLEVLLSCTRALGQALEKWKDFEVSKKTDRYICQVERLRERGSRLYQKSMHVLHQEQDIRVIVNWCSIYECINRCLGACERAADMVTVIGLAG